jgi:hypothetical protein
MQLNSAYTKRCVADVILRLPVSPAKVAFIKTDLLASKHLIPMFQKDNKDEAPDMTIITGRRSVLRTVALTVTAGAIGLASAAKPAAAAAKSALTPAGATHLNALMKRLAQAPRRRDFKTVPMVFDHPEQWDHEALTEVLSYQHAAKQAWDNTDIAGPWLNMMRNALNTQIWSFKFLAVSVTHGTADLALYDQTIWDKYQLTSLAGDEFRTNTLIIERNEAAADTGNHEDPAGPSPAMTFPYLR